MCKVKSSWMWSCHCVQKPCVDPSRSKWGGKIPRSVTTAQGKLSCRFSVGSGGRGKQAKLNESKLLGLCEAEGAGE